MRKVTLTVPAPADLGTDVAWVPEGNDLELDLRLESVMEGVLVTGTVRGAGEGECVRCLDDAQFKLDVRLMELFAYPDRMVEDENDDNDVRELGNDDLIDLEPALRDAVVLALPFQPVCRNDCPGLCSECGVRRADDPGHHHEVADPRWAALQDILDAGVAVEQAGSPDVGDPETEKES